MKQILIIGSGNFGTALAQVLATNCKVSLLTRHQDILDSIQNTRENQRYFPGVKLNENITAIKEYPSFDDYEYIIFAIPASCVLSEFYAIQGQLTGRPSLIPLKDFLNLARPF